jgi:hypothetical protein
MSYDKIRRQILRLAELHEIVLSDDDFTEENGFLLIDGMPADDWLDAMIQE